VVPAEASVASKTTLPETGGLLSAVCIRGTSNLSERPRHPRTSIMNAGTASASTQPNRNGRSALYRQIAPSASQPRRVGDLSVFERSDRQRRRFGNLRQRSTTARQPDAVPQPRATRCIWAVSLPPQEGPRISPGPAAVRTRSPTTPQPQRATSRNRAPALQSPDQGKPQTVPPALPDRPK